jgi:putative hemolysin
MITFILVFLIIILTIASAFFSLSEIAFFSLPSSKIKAYRHQLDPRKRQIAKLLKQSRSLLVTIFLLNTVVNILVQNTTSDLFDPIASSWMLKVGVPLAIILIFGELLPKYIGLLYNEKISEFSAPFYEWVQNAIAPLLNAITQVANFFSRILFFYLKIEKPISQDELEHLLKTSEGRGIVHKEEAKLLQGYLSLEGKFVKDLMQPRNAIDSYDIELPLTKLIFLFSEKLLTEVPVCKGSLDNFLGMLNVIDFFIHRNEIKSGEELCKLLHKPFYVPETTSLKHLLDQFEEREEKIALVVDEYGAISGLITKYDLIEAISKPILTSQERTADYTKVAKDAIIANGTMPLEDLVNLFGEELESLYHSVTIGGYLTEKLGFIPTAGTTYQEKALFFRILSADHTHIRKVYIQDLKPKSGT